MAGMRNRSSRNGKNKGGRQNGGRRHNNSGNTVNLSAAKSNYEKFIEKAKESKSSGDRISAENFFQYADHYKRILIEAEERKEAQEEVRKEAQEKKEQETQNIEDSLKIEEEQKAQKAKESASKEPENDDKSSDSDVEKKSNIPEELLA